MKAAPAEYFNSRQDEWIRVYKRPLHHRCKCQAKVRIVIGKNYQRLEFFGTHDETSHAVDYSKNLKHLQIVAIHEAVMVAPTQSAAVLLRNLMHAKGSQEQHKHMHPSQLRCIQRRVQTSRKILIKKKLAAASGPNPLASSLGGVRQKIFMLHCASTTILPMSIAFHSFLLFSR